MKQLTQTMKWDERRTDQPNSNARDKTLAMKAKKRTKLADASATVSQPSLDRNAASGNMDAARPIETQLQLHADCATGTPLPTGHRAQAAVGLESVHKASHTLNENERKDKSRVMIQNDQLDA
jgi:uncharacterized membrane protein